MRSWSGVALILVVVTLPACGSKTLVVPTAGAPRFPDFVEPKVPLAMTSTSASGTLARAWQFLQAGDVRNAEREAMAAVRLPAAVIPATATLAYIDMARRDARGAVVKFDRALAMDAGYVPALVGKGQALASLNRDEEAVTALEGALHADGSLVDVARRLDVLRLRVAQRSIAAARQAGRAGKFEEAIGAYRAAIERSPDSSFLYRELAVIERDHGDGTLAIVHYRRATALDPSDVASWRELGEMLEARNEFDSALKAYAEAIALEPEPETIARRDALRLRADVARLPAEYRSIADAARITRGDFAALIGVRLPQLVTSARLRDVGVITDLLGHWAERWILEVSRAGFMDPFENHTFQPRALVRRVDCAQIVARLLARVAALSPTSATHWQNARGRFLDVAPTHAAYAAVSAAVAAGAMATTAEGTFSPSAVVSGADATEAIVRVLALAGTPAVRP